MGQIALFVVVVAAIVLLFWSVRRPARVEVVLRGPEMFVLLRGADVLWTFRRRIAVRTEYVRGVAVSDLERVPREGLRLPGIAIPGMIRAGSYGVGSQRSFWDVRRGPQVLWVEMQEGAAYRRIVVEVDDPHSTALGLRSAVGSWVPPEWEI